MKNANNWKLIAVLGGLIIVFLGVRFYRSPLRESNLPGQLVELDSAETTQILIRPARQIKSEIKLMKSGHQWQLTSSDGTKGRLESGAASVALGTLINLRPNQMVARRANRWNEFRVGDSTGTHVQVKAGDDVQADLWIGRSAFASGQGGMFSGGAHTYVRRQGEREVYAVPGFLDGQFNRLFDDWRDKTFIRLKRDSIDRITFLYPADSSFVLERRNGWHLGNILADSAAVANYLNLLEYKNVSTFAAGPPTGEPPLRIVFERRAAPIVTLEAWPTANGWTLGSSLQPETYFAAPTLSVHRDVWKGKRDFLPVRK